MECHFAHSMTTQFVIGLALYLFISPITTAAFGNFGAAMKDRTMRFWAVEHIFAMFVALALAHIGNARARKGATDEAKHKQQLSSSPLLLSLFLRLFLLALLELRTTTRCRGKAPTDIP